MIFEKINGVKDCVFYRVTLITINIFFSRTDFNIFIIAALAYTKVITGYLNIFNKNSRVTISVHLPFGLVNTRGKFFHRVLIRNRPDDAVSWLGKMNIQIFSNVEGGILVHF